MLNHCFRSNWYNNIAMWKLFCVDEFLPTYNYIASSFHCSRIQFEPNDGHFNEQDQDHTHDERTNPMTQFLLQTDGNDTVFSPKTIRWNNLIETYSKIEYQCQPC